jgi:hypothetical protein
MDRFTVKHCNRSYERNDAILNIILSAINSSFSSFVLLREKRFSQECNPELFALNFGIFNEDVNVLNVYEELLGRNLFTAEYLFG